MSITTKAEFPLTAEAKKKAKHLQSILKPLLPEISHGECLNIVSRQNGERDWNTYLAKLKHTCSVTFNDEEADAFIRDTALPLIVKTASKYGLKIIVEHSQIENGISRLGETPTRRLPMRIEPLNAQLGETYCEPSLDVTTKSLHFLSDWIYVGLNFIFPKEAFSVLASIFAGNKACIDDEPCITRFESQREQCYMFTVKTSGVTDSADHDKNIVTDPLVLKVFQKGLDRLFSAYGRTTKAYSALYGKWGNKKLVTNFENALWRMQTDTPSYMAASSHFYSTVIAGLQFNGSLTDDGPYILRGDEEAAIGVCSIVHLEDGEEDKPGGYYIAKYGDKWQAKIHLKGFSESDVDVFTAKFGIPRGRNPERDTIFYHTPAFECLCTWAKSNPKFAKRASKGGGRYLPDWYEQVMVRLSEKTAGPTNQDFLKAIEKEPYLINFGIRCSSHVDWKKSMEENNAIFRGERESFANSGYSQFSVCCEWLKGCTPRKTVNTSFSSYMLKEMVEAWAKKISVDDYYVSNGAFIAAAIHMGFDWKPDFDSPNVRFNISGKSPAIIALKVTL